MRLSRELPQSPLKYEDKASFVKPDCKGRLSKVSLIEKGLLLEVWAWINVQGDCEERVGGGICVHCRQHNCRRLHGLLKRPMNTVVSSEQKQGPLNPTAPCLLIILSCCQPVMCSLFKTNTFQQSNLKTTARTIQKNNKKTEKT